jgi:HK97 family phage prohead protease
METKRIDLPFEIKEVTAEGKFSGYASLYDEIDLGGDVVRKGAFAKTVRESKSVPILWQHDSREVIGMGALKDTKDGLMIEGELDMEDSVAVKAHRKMKRGMIRGLSIGFNTIKSSPPDVMPRELLEVKLWEVSVVTFPMLPSAQITHVKSVSDEDVATLKDQIQALSAEIATLKGAGAGSGAAIPNTEPAANDHSELIAGRLDSMLALIPQ